MSDTAFTPGPWRASSFERSFYSRDDKSVWIYGTAGPNNPRIARVQFGLDYGQDIYAETVANANLIAAAPALYEALDELVSFIKAHVPILKDNPLIEDADAALALARGESS